MNSKSKSIEPEIKRLILAKGVYLHGCVHAMNKDEMSRLLAVHHFDFAVEMILKSLATKYGVLDSARKEFRFKDLWNEIVRKNVNLPFRQQIFDLRDVRNLAQHAGVVPPYEEVIKFKGYVEDFLRSVVKSEFGIDFDKLTIAELIENEKIKQTMIEAEQALSKKNYRECISKCADALIDASFDLSLIHI